MLKVLVVIIKLKI